MKNKLFRFIYIIVAITLIVVPQRITYAEGNISDTSNPIELQTENGTMDINQQGLKKELHGFYPAFINYTPELEKYIDKLSSISFAWSRFYADSLDTLSTVKGVHNNTSFYYPQDYMEPIRYAKTKGKSIQLSIFADWKDAQLILPYEDKRNAAIQTVIKVLNQDISNGEAIFYDGVVIDFEGLRNTDGKGNDILIDNQHISDYFNEFLNELNIELDKSNKKLYVAVNPKLYFDGFDYREIIKVADKMIIMAHDYEPASALRKNEVMQYTGYNSLTPIDSLAPIRKIRSALEDAKNSVDTMEALSKVWLQIAFDSSQWQFEIPANRDWESMDSLSSSKGKRSTPTYKMIKDRIDNVDGKGSQISYGYNNELQSPYIQYFNVSDKTHNIIIYEDTLSINAKLDLVKAYNLGGVSVWSIGNIPDYNDLKGKNFHLDVWDSMLSALQSTEPLKGNDNIKVVFQDKNLEEIIRTKLDKKNQDIYKSDIEGIYRLELPEGTTNINDLKMFKNLEYLKAQNLGIKDIGALSSLKNLRVLYLQRNQISDISALKGLTKLQFLSLNGNRIVNIDALAALKELKELYLSENQISSLTPIANMSKLGKLSLNSNKIRDVSSLSKLGSLYELSIEGNSISSLKPLEKLNKLIYLNAANNRITDMTSLKNMKCLEALYLQRNLIKNINGLQELRELKKLSLNGNQITDIGPLGTLTKLTELYIKDNKITKVAKLKNLKNLNTLYLGGNKITDLNTIKGNLATVINCDYV